ncbi:MAG: hypothetical protein ABDK94_03325 [Atribacterota bacterium]
MTRKIFFLFFLGWFISFTLPLFAEDGIRIRAENILYGEKEGKIEAWGKVMVSWQEISVQTERALFFLPELELVVPVPVEASLGANRVRGSAFYYSFKRKEGWVKEAELFYKLGEQGELLFRGQKIQYAQGKWRGEHVLLTGCHRAPPLYSIRVKEVVVLPQERLVMEGLDLYIRNQKILEIPRYSVSLQGGGGGFSPDFGYERDKGYYLWGRYEYPFGDHCLFLAQAELATRQGFSWGVDFLFTVFPWEARIFGDFYRDKDDTMGGYVRFRSGVFSFWGIVVRNEHVEVDGTTVTFSRFPQYVLSLEEKREEGFSWEAHWSSGCFQEKDLTLWREDLYLGAQWQSDSWGAQAFFWHTAFESGESIPRLGGSVWWEKEISPTLDLKLSYRFLDTEQSPFSFDPKKENLVALELIWGNEKESFLHARGEYNLEDAQWEKMTLGLGLGNEEFSVGAEGIYSFQDEAWTGKRYFVRKKIEDCVEVEASFWEPEQSFFLSLNLSGLDAGKKKSKTLFEEGEGCAFFEVKRNVWH